MTIRALAADEAFAVRRPYEGLLRPILEDDDTALLVHGPLVELDGLDVFAAPAAAVDGTGTENATCEQRRSVDRSKDVISRGVLATASAGACGRRLSLGTGESVNLRLRLDRPFGGGRGRLEGGGM